jgi:hypothetical protein
MPDVADERFASLQLVSYLPTPGTGTQEKMELLLRERRRTKRRLAGRSAVK